MTYRELNHLTAYLSNKYLALEKKEQKNEADKRYCTLIKLALNCLSIESQLILQRDFFRYTPNIILTDNMEIDLARRQLIYSSSTYYRKKRKAMDEFINCLHNQKMI